MLHGLTFEHEGKTLTFDISHYHDEVQRTAITIFTAKKTPYMVLTVNAPEYDLDEGELLIKAYSENSDLAEYLRDGEFFADTGKRHPLGWVEAEIWKIKT